MPERKPSTTLRARNSSRAIRLIACGCRNRFGSAIGRVAGGYWTACSIRVADAYDRLAPSLAATLMIEIIIRWFEHGSEESPREIAMRSSLLASSLLKEVSTWE